MAGAVLLTAFGLSAVPSTAQAVEHRCDGRVATVVGTSGNDRLRGTPGDDVIVGLGGWDVIRGRGGDDVLCGNVGSDTVVGGRGEDWLHGGRGAIVDDRSGPHLRNDHLRGGPGADRLIGGGDPDALPAPLPDIVDFSTAAHGVMVDLETGTSRGQGRDRLARNQAWYVVGSSHDDHLVGSSFADHLAGGLGADRLEGRNGADVIVGDPSRPGDRADDVLFGQGGPDHLAAAGGRDLLDGGPGADEISDWGASVDQLEGGPGDDWLTDTVVPKPGQAVRGGGGENRIDLWAKPLGDPVTTPSGVLDLRIGTAVVDWATPTTIVVAGFTEVRAPDGPWTIRGTGADEYFWEAQLGPRTILAGGGDDVLGGSRHADHLDGGGGHDTALPEGGIDTCVGIEEVVGAACEAGP